MLTPDGQTQPNHAQTARRSTLDPAGLKRHLADRFAEEPYQRSLAGREAARRLAEQWEADQIANHGEHGTESRYLAGCYCDPCQAAAPHGSAHRFDNGACICGLCLDWAVGNGYRFLELPVLVDIAAGRAVQGARKVDGHYGTSWVTPDGAFVPVGRKRRSTVTSRGFTYATAAFVGRDLHGHDWREHRFVPAAMTSTPVRDDWGEPIRPATGI